MQQQRKRLTVRQKGFVYRYPTFFFITGTFLGTCMVLSPLIYNFTHTSEEIEALKATLPFQYREKPQQKTIGWD